MPWFPTKSPSPPLQRIHHDHNSTRTKAHPPLEDPVSNSKTRKNPPKIQSHSKSTTVHASKTRPPHVPVRARECASPAATCTTVVALGSTSASPAATAISLAPRTTTTSDWLLTLLAPLLSPLLAGASFQASLHTSPYKTSRTSPYHRSHQPVSPHPNTSQSKKEEGQKEKKRRKKSSSFPLEKSPRSYPVHHPVPSVTGGAEPKMRGWQ